MKFFLRDDDWSRPDVRGVTDELCAVALMIWAVTFLILLLITDFIESAGASGLRRPVLSQSGTHRPIKGP